MRSIAATQDVLSAEISGALVEGNVLAFRREVEFPVEEANLTKIWQPHYLLVPWLPEATTEWELEAERESYFVADHLTFCEFVDGGERHMDIGKDVQKSVVSLDFLSNSVTEALGIANKLQRQVAFEMQPDVRRTAYEVVQQLHSSVSRVGLALLPATDIILSKKDDWHRANERVMQHFSRVLSVRALPQVNPLSESLGDSRAHTTIGKTLEHLAQEAHRIQNDFRSATTSLNDMLEQERRERQDREEQRQRLIGYGLAALAAVGAFPLLVGQWVRQVGTSCNKRCRHGQLLWCGSSLYM